MAKGKDKPKPLSQVKRNPDRRNGKATKKHPHVGAGKANGGKYGYSRKRLEAMLAEQRKTRPNMDMVDLLEQIGEELAARKERAQLKPRSVARLGIGDVTYKMASVDRHFDKTRPYPCVPKGSKHAGKPDSKTDTKDSRPKRAVPQQRQATKAEEMAVVGALLVS